MLLSCWRIRLTAKSMIFNSDLYAMGNQNMKLLRFGAAGHEKPGILDTAGRIRDLSTILDDHGGATLSRRALEMLSRQPLESLPIVDGATKAVA